MCAMENSDQEDQISPDSSDVNSSLTSTTESSSDMSKSGNVLDLSNTDQKTEVSQSSNGQFQKRKAECMSQPMANSKISPTMFRNGISANMNGHASTEAPKMPRLEPFNNNNQPKAFDDNEFIFESLERITDELAVVKQYLQELPQKLILNMSCLIKAEVDLQFQNLSRKLLAEMRQTTQAISVANRGGNQPPELTHSATSMSPRSKIDLVASKVANESAASNTFQPIAVPPPLSVKTVPKPPIEQTPVKPLVVKSQSAPKFSSFAVPGPTKLPGSNLFYPQNMPNQIAPRGPIGAVAPPASNITANAAVAQNFASQFLSLTQNQGASNEQSKPINGSAGPSSAPPAGNMAKSPNQNLTVFAPSTPNAATAAGPNSSTISPDQLSLQAEVVGPKYIQAPVQIRIEDLHADCSVHKVKIIDTVPPVDVFDLDEEFMYRLFIKYKYPSIFVQALFVLHFGSFRAMHLNTSSRVKNNLELIPENFVNSLTVLVLKWFPAVDDLDFGKCLNQKQRSILSAARSCLFFKKCDACKKRDIDSLPSTYSVKNLTLIAAQQNMKREATLANSSRPFNNYTASPFNQPMGGFPSSYLNSPAPTFVKTESLMYPTPPSSDSLSSPLMDFSESINSVFERVNEIVNGPQQQFSSLVKSEAMSNDSLDDSSDVGPPAVSNHQS
ncbi:uncharacterized protein LOC142343279 isoform X2 [Convolutriloba macropyga]|uniref:uncharacterized protein LOC142343279 isoform X2 n=1 Tax=Convolutriloba macropyga TaxID=536237 RepID=UPI003F51B67F